MTRSIQRTFESLFDFLDTFRADIRDGYLGVPTDDTTFASGAACSVTLVVPGFDEEVIVESEVVDVLDAGIVLRLDDTAASFDRLTEMFELCGKVIEQMLATGRFKIVGQPSAGQPAAGQPVGGAAGPAASPGVSDADVSSPGPASSMRAAPGAIDDDGVPLDMEPDASGELDQRALVQAMMSAYREQFNGVMRIDHPLGTSKVFFSKGGPVQVLDDPVVVEECLGVLLLRAGRIDEIQLKASLEMMNDTGKLQGECLIDMGLLSFPVLVMALMKQTEMKMLRLYEQAEGTYARYPLAHHRVKFITPPLKLPGVLYKTLRNQYEAMSGQDVAERQTPKLDLYAMVKLDFALDDLQLRRSETEFLEILTARSYRLREVYSVSNMGRRLTAVNVMALMDLGILVLQADEDTTQILDTLLKQLEDKLRTMEDQNHFERLEVHWSARDDDIEKGYERLRHKWEGAGGGIELPPRHDKMRQDVLAALKESYTLLRDTSQRQRYRGEVYEAQQISFSADIFFRQGEMLMIKKKWREVIDNCTRAAELRPDIRKYANAAKAARAKMNE